MMEINPLAMFKGEHYSRPCWLERSHSRVLHWKQEGVLGICHVSHLYMGTLEMIKYDITCVKYIYIYGTVLFNLNKTVVVFEPIHLKNMFITTSSSSPSFATTYPVKVVWTAIKATPTRAFQKYITWNLRFFCGWLAEKQWTKSMMIYSGDQVIS